MGSMARGQTMYPADGHATYLTPDAPTIVMVSLDKKTKLAYWKVCHRFTGYCHLNGVVIRITYLCNEHPLTPHFYREKVGFTRVYIFFLFLLQNIDCGYSLEPPR